ncbi:hypothetical protein MCEGE10_01289 [Flavobacteriaceae bacterium]
MHIIHKKNYTNNYYSFNLVEVSVSTITKIEKKLSELALSNLV